MPSISNRFSGSEGDRLLRDLLGRQFCLNGLENVVSKFVPVLKRKVFNKGEVIFQQGASDNKIAFILTGQTSITINERLIAVRNAGQHVGEMSLIDSAAKRSATVTAVEESVIGFVSEKNFTLIANEHPIIWRRLAIELGDRLRQRTAAIRPPNLVPSVFIGSSSEALPVAKALKKSFAADPFNVTLWNEDVFLASDSTMESLERQLIEADFAILVLSPDDNITSRKKILQGPRDNVVFELGLCMGALGRRRSFIVAPSNTPLKIPSDLMGLTQLRYAPAGAATLSFRLKKTCEDIRSRMLALKPR